MNNKEPGLFDIALRMEKLSSMGDPLERLKKLVNFEKFRTILKFGFGLDQEHKGPGGRPPYDLVLRFKVLILQALYNLSDDSMEYQLNDRRSFMRFLDLTEKDPIPDAKTIWHWRETLTRKGTMEKLFNKFWKMLEDSGIEANSGSIVDATFVDKPKNRNSRDDNQKIKDGEVPEEWEKPENKSKLIQKDLDARWAKKNNETHYGYKNHVKVDRKTKLIRKYHVTDASVHDSQALEHLLDKCDSGKNLHGDSAYSGEPCEKIIEKFGAIPKINGKGYRNHKLTESEKRMNKRLSKIRARVEHVFGHMTESMGGLVIRCVGMIRSAAVIALKNIAYNMQRFCFLIG